MWLFHVSNFASCFWGKTQKNRVKLTPKALNVNLKLNIRFISPNKTRYIHFFVAEIFNELWCKILISYIRNFLRKIYEIEINKDKNKNKQIITK